MYESVPASPLNSPAESLPDSDDLHHPRLRRCRTSSSLFSAGSKITLALPSKTDPSIYLTVRTGTKTFGAFAPTSDAHSALQLFAAPRRSRKSLPKFAPPLPMGAGSLSIIPSISRTASAASPISTDLRVPPSPASAAAASLLDFERPYARPTPRRVPATAPASPVPSVSASRNHSRDQTPTGTPPALASLERRSRLCSVQVRCATCSVSGSNFPSCARCGLAWCSRACRVPGGVRHTCVGTGAGAPSSSSHAGTGISTPPIAIPTPHVTAATISSTPVPSIH